MTVLLPTTLFQVKEQESLLDKESASRVTSLNPSASFYVRNRSERSSYLPMRSASMRETSYSRSIRRRRGQQHSTNDTLSVNNDQQLASNRSSVQNLAIAEVAGEAHGNGTVVEEQ